MAHDLGPCSEMGVFGPCDVVAAARRLSAASLEIDRRFDSVDAPWNAVAGDESPATGSTGRDAMNRLRIGLQSLVVLGTFLVPHAAPGHAAEPCRCPCCGRHSPRAEGAQVEFAVTDGWVEFTVRQAGEPVSGAQVTVFDTDGHKFASGETGPNGRGTFPLPRGPALAVEIQFDQRVAEPILLSRVDGALLPADVLLSFGAKPCCRRARTENQEPCDMAGSLRPLGLCLLSGGTLCLLLGMLGMALPRLRPAPPLEGVSDVR
jgi:hypothetical protein